MAMSYERVTVNNEESKDRALGHSKVREVTKNSRRLKRRPLTVGGGEPAVLEPKFQ